MRIVRLAGITAVLFSLLWWASQWTHRHLGTGLIITAGTVGLVDEYLMRLFPAQIEPAGPGGLGVR